MAESDNESGGGGSNASSLSAAAAAREQDRFLPIANVSRIMKKALPANAKISKEAKETVQECVSEFISFITGEASDKCQREKRKTVNGDDLLWAMTTLGFEDYVDPLKLYLQKFREIEGEKGGGAPPGGGNGGTGVPSPDSQPPRKEGGGGMMTTMMGQHMYGPSLYHHLNHLNHHHQSQYQYQYQHQNQNQNQHHQIGMGDGSASASSSAGIGNRGDRI